MVNLLEGKVGGPWPQHGWICAEHLSIVADSRNGKNYDSIETYLVQLMSIVVAGTFAK